MKASSIIATAALVLVTATAHAGEPRSPDVIPQKARSLAEKGRALHNSGDYGNAIVAFKEAYVMAPSSGLLFNLAQAYRLQGNCDDASLMYRRYLDTEPSPDAKTIAKAHLHSVERCVQKRGLDIAFAPTSTPGSLQPPDPDGTMYMEAPRSARPEIQKNVGIGLTIGGAIALSIAGYYAYDASSASSSIEDAYARGAKWKDVAAIDERGERSARFAKILGVGGGLAVVGGVTMYLLGKRAERLTPIAVLPTKSGAEVSYAWRF